MGFSNEWEQTYSGSKHLSIWPWSDLVSYTMRYCKPHSRKLRVLELGCGAGANIPFFKKLEADYHAIEGSPTMVHQLHEVFPDLKENILIGDFTAELPFDGQFDLIVDRASITHNTTHTIEKALKLVATKLKSNGDYIGIDWFSTAHSEFKKGEEATDNYTRTNFQVGQFTGLGRVHFSDKPHLLELFKDFEVLHLEHKVITREIFEDNTTFASWNIHAKSK